MCKELLIPPGTQNYVVRMRLYDVNKQLLCLTIRIVLRAQGALKILISAPYWLVNKTGMLLDLCIDYRLMIWICNLNWTQLYCTTHNISIDYCVCRAPSDLPPRQWENGCRWAVWGAWVSQEFEPIALLLHWQRATQYVSAREGENSKNSHCVFPPIKCFCISYLISLHTFHHQSHLFITQHSRNVI